MIRSLYFPKDGNLQIDLNIEAFRTALQDPEGLLWVDFEATPPEEDEPVLREVFGFPDRSHLTRVGYLSP